MWFTNPVPLLILKCSYRLRIRISGFQPEDRGLNPRRSTNNYKEIQNKIDRDKVYKMYDSGMKQVEISKHFNVTKSTISKIIKDKYCGVEQSGSSQGS